MSKLHGILAIAALVALDLHAADLSEIHVSQCRLNDIGFDSDYADVLIAFGSPIREESHTISTGSADRPRKSMEFEGLDVSLFEDKVTNLQTTSPKYILFSGASVGSTRREILNLYGATPEIFRDEHISALWYLCRCLNEGRHSGVLTILLQDGVVFKILLSKQ